jgi:murein DD-endopeptidase MepM/ murein hydrolase activator NlpD
VSTATTAVVGGAVAVTLVVCGIGAVALAALTGNEACTTTAPAGSTGPGRWSGEQVANATTVVAVGSGMRVPAYGWVVAVATAMQESGLRNLGDLGATNDHDSLGLFQQRPSQGWGTPAQVMDPAYAARTFYQKLLRVAGWQQLPLTEAAQRVQISAYPDAYAKHEADARALVNTIAAQLGLTGDCGGPWVNPMPPGSYVLTSPYGPRWGSFHAGQDFAAPTGTPIRAAAAGTVRSAECTSPFCDRPGVVDANGNPTTPGCGLRVVLIHPGGVATMYCHASALAVHEGQTVTAGQVIAWVGSTGNATGPHLHFQVHLNAPPFDASTSTDPVAYLKSAGVEV